MGAAVGRSLVLLAICASSAACEGKAGADSDGTASWPSCAAACQLEGRCTVRDGGCAAASDADCGQSEACRFLGKCAPDRRGACVFGAATDADCRKGRAGIDPCAQWGYCRAVDGRCVAGSDEDCWQSRHCLQYGKCAARDGTCRHTAATDADCWTAVGTEEAETCVEWGFCTARDGVCVAASDADCGQSDQCHDIGKCVADGLGSCTVGSEADCRRSFLCGGGGDCSAEEGWCVRRADDGSPRSPPLPGRARGALVLPRGQGLRLLGEPHLHRLGPMLAARWLVRGRLRCGLSALVPVQDRRRLQGPRRLVRRVGAIQSASRLRRRR